jgi:hypothetical protein
MNEFSRRSFLKGMVAIAAGLSLPLDVIEKASNAIEVPAGYKGVYNIFLSSGWKTVALEQVFIVKKSAPFSQRKLKCNEARQYCVVEFTPFEPIDFAKDKVSYSIFSDILPFKFNGNGVVSRGFMTEHAIDGYFEVEID